MVTAPCFIYLLLFILVVSFIVQTSADAWEKCSVIAFWLMDLPYHMSLGKQFSQSKSAYHYFNTPFDFALWSPRKWSQHILQVLLRSSIKWIFFYVREIYLRCLQYPIKTFSGIFQTIYSFVSLVLPSEFHGCENFSIDTETLTLDVVITARRSYGNFGKKVRNLKLNSSKAAVTTAFVPKIYLH